MKIRFVRGTGWGSEAIVLQEKTCMPFTPSHVEALTPDGLSYVGSRLDGGTQARPVGYDAGKVARLPDGYDPVAFPAGLCDMVLDLGGTMDATFYKYLNDSIGEPYDWKAIVGFVLPEHLHLADHAICSAKIALALRKCGWLAWPVAAPAHLINPRDLLLMVSARMKVPGI
jgi:hypothetical protein